MRCRVNLQVELEIDAFTLDDAIDLAKESVYDLDGLGVTVIDVTLVHGREEC
jgi:hypothetical protein